ncbi:hypothetical protein [Zoogloea sp.]|uniref:hypothetical protein n=1 Tax=Zoogloea sp. TaxID=49181 RepID=UPI00262B7825|nr:hypothetical protein [Zoogloea sp.]MDD3353570.1 hypothetical protein [Zoogloea sp.]
MGEPPRSECADLFYASLVVMAAVVPARSTPAPAGDGARQPWAYMRTRAVRPNATHPVGRYVGSLR